MCWRHTRYLISIFIKDKVIYGRNIKKNILTAVLIVRKISSHFIHLLFRIMLFLAGVWTIAYVTLNVTTCSLFSSVYNPTWKSVKLTVPWWSVSKEHYIYISRRNNLYECTRVMSAARMDARSGCVRPL